MKATKSSRAFIKILKATDITVSELPSTAPSEHPIKIRHVKTNIARCPLNMFANNRIIKAIGLVNISNSSIRGISGIGNFNHRGTSGQKISFQYLLVPKIFMQRKEQTARK